MSCSRYRIAISTRLDGEGPPRTPGGAADDVDGAAIDAHLAQCADCRAFAEEAERLHRAVRLAPAPEVPDLTTSILSAIDAERSSGTEPVFRSGTEPVRRSGTEPVRRSGTEPVRDQERALRVLLAAIALVQVAVAVPALVLGDDAGLPTHTARHLGSFEVALAVGFLVAAWRPARIPGILPIVGALVLCLVGSTLLDVASGDAGAWGEAHHATDVAGLVVVWLLGRVTAREPRLGRGDAPGQVRIA